MRANTKLVIVNVVKICSTSTIHCLLIQKLLQHYGYGIASYMTIHMELYSFSCIHTGMVSEDMEIVH